MSETFSENLTATIRLGVYNGVGPQTGLSDSKPVEVRPKFCESYKSEYPVISGEIHEFLQKHYYLDVYYGKNEFVYLTSIGDKADEKNFSMSVTVAGKPVVFESAGTKLRILSQDLDFKSFNACFLGKLSEAKLLTLTKLVPGAKRTDLIFGPNCKGIVKLFKKAGIEDLSDSSCWESVLNLDKAVLDEDYVTADENKVVSKLLGQLLNFYESSEFEKKCQKKDCEGDMELIDRHKGKNVKKVLKKWHKKIGYSA